PLDECARVTRVLTDVRVVSRRIDVCRLFHKLFNRYVAERAMKAELFVKSHHFRLTQKIEIANGLISLLSRILDGSQLESRGHALPSPRARHAGEAVHDSSRNRLQEIEISEPN